MKAIKIYGLILLAFGITGFVFFFAMILAISDISVEEAFSNNSDYIGVILVPLIIGSPFIISGSILLISYLKNIRKEIYNQNNSEINQQHLPDYKNISIFGIISLSSGVIPLPLIGLILGTISMIKIKKTKHIYIVNPSLYTQKSYSHLIIGKVCSITGIFFSVLYSIPYIMLIIDLGSGSFR